MTFMFKAAVLAAVLGQARATPVASMVATTFFVPMPEDTMFYNTFESINSIAQGPVTSMISVVISVDNTRVYWDHWEDGFEADATNPTSSTTKIWGDGKASNGCAPSVTVCTDAADVLRAGQSIVISSVIPVPRVKANIFYDGGDRVQASYPITLTRAGFPSVPGSLMAGAVEILDTTMYGKEFVTPVGVNTQDWTSTQPFTYSCVYLLAAESGTQVTLPNGTVANMAMGQTITVNQVNQNAKITSNKPVLADLITGDPGSTYELRWYSLLEVSKWHNAYLGPVGDSVAQTKYVMFNPGPNSMTISYSYLSNPSTMTQVNKVTATLAAGQNAITDMIPTNSAVKFTAANKFFALSIHDTWSSGGQIYDWGYPVMPTSWLTPQVVVGLGFGCTGNTCLCSGSSGTICGAGTTASAGERSVVWISPEEDAWVFADYNNDGVVDNTTFIKALQGIHFMDKTDEDLSGALFFARKTNDVNGVPVDIAAAWGQNGAYSGSNDDYALDLGTVVLPVATIQATKSAVLVNDADKNGAVSPGDTLEYVIQVINMGASDIATGSYVLVDSTLPTGVAYIPGTFKFVSSTGGLLFSSDDTTGTPFPLDGTGMTSKANLAKRGGTHDYKFQVSVLPTCATNAPLVNTATVTYGATVLNPTVSTPVVPPLSWAPPPPPPSSVNGSCLNNSYKGYNRPGTLACTASDIRLGTVSASSAAQCVKGKNITLNLTAAVQFNMGTYYDAGWYIASDGGDALNGRCSVNFLQSQYSSAARITSGVGENLIRGNVSWTGDALGGNDECGDATVFTGGGTMVYNIAVNAQVRCQDTDGDGKLDASICFTWRPSTGDSACNVINRLNAGQIPELYPGTINSCFCAKYDVDNVVVLDPGNKVFPC